MSMIDFPKIDSQGFFHDWNGFAMDRFNDPHLPSAGFTRRGVLAASSDPANACSWRASSTCSTTHDSGSDKGNHDVRGGRTVQTSRARPTIPSPGRQERRKTEMVAGGGGADRPRVMSFALLGGPVYM